MKSTAASVVVVLLLVLNNSLVQGILETNDASHKCKCLKTAEGVPLRSISTIVISPPKGACRNTECIVTLRTGRKVCVSPTHKWLEDVFRYLKRNKATTPKANIEKQRQDSR
ncbi:C-X-C motif chemokine 13 [Trichosurus vulpecula]|uniref:C-X-C motif chemokine 13 n=1 Tax=Trichosurus vulpecula TaxID=9337 RepID=UPI00186B16EA|nr:C-X-C motif chemokine 13 [Trichosurus vulpecula]